MRGHHLCPKCRKSYASSQSLWNHRQKCAVGRGATVPIEGATVPKIDTFLNEIVEPPPEEDLVEKFITLFRAYWQEKQHEHRDEILAIIEQLLQKGLISSETADRVPKLVETIEDENVASAIENVIAPDKSEVLTVLNELKTESTRDVVKEVEHLFEDFVRGEAKLPELDRLLKGELYNIVPKSQIFRIKILIKNIARVQQCINDIVRKFRQTPADKKSRLEEFESMLKRDLISTEQYLKLVDAVEDIELNELLDIIQK